MRIMGNFIKIKIDENLGIFYKIINKFKKSRTYVSERHSITKFRPKFKYKSLHYIREYVK